MYGALSSVFLPVDRETGRPRGFAFVEFADPAVANAAIQRLNNQLGLVLASGAVLSR